MAFGKKKEGMYLRPRVRRVTPLMDIAFAIILGGASGVYIFKDTMMRWQISEGYDPLSVNADSQGASAVASAPATAAPTETKE